MCLRINIAPRTVGMCTMQMYILFIAVAYKVSFCLTFTKLPTYESYASKVEIELKYSSRYITFPKVNAKCDSYKSNYKYT